MATAPQLPLLTKKLISRTLYVLFPLALLHFLLSNHPNATISSSAATISSSDSIPPHVLSQLEQINNKADDDHEQCNFAEGQWVESSRPPLYNGTACAAMIKPEQNCMAHGRPDTGYLYWRWQPNACILPRFDPAEFLSLIRNRHLAFIGDSMARNQLESLLCLLSSHSAPRLVFREGEDNKYRQFRRWVFPSHNVTVSYFWSPFLVEGAEKTTDFNHNKLYVDVANRRWASQSAKIDVVVFSVGHWFLHPAVFYEEGRMIGCHHCQEFKNFTELGFFDVFRKSVRTSLREVKRVHDSLAPDLHKLVVVTTFSPAHFEGDWDKAGACPKKEPYKQGEKKMEYMDNEMNKIEMEEVAAVEDGEGERRLRFQALDVTRMAMLRADGHPGPYMNPNPFHAGANSDRVQNDCVHWCLPGPIDTWNEIFLEMVKRWKRSILLNF